MLNRAALARVAYENVEDVYCDGVVLSELRFAPSFIRVGKPNLTYEEIIDAVLEGIHKGVQEFGIEVGLIHIIPRSLDPKENAAATEMIFRFKQQHPLGKRYLVGIDLADAEVTTNPKDFIPWIERARLNDLQVTIHSAEDSSYQHGLKAIELYQPKRIGHGIKLADNDAALDYVLKANIHLENCPTSNWLTRSVATIEQHPFKKIFDRGVSVSLNSDDPHLMGIDLTHEYELAQKHWGFTPEILKDLNRRNLEHSFLSREQINKVWARFFQLQ
jgi:adenosine deaminase